MSRPPAAVSPPDRFDRLLIDTLRFLSVDAVQNADSGHPGMPLGAAPMAYVLWNRFLRHNPKDPKWFGRDRFVPSAGRGSMLLYSLLHLPVVEHFTYAFVSGGDLMEGVASEAASLAGQAQKAALR